MHKKSLPVFLIIFFTALSLFISPSCKKTGGDGSIILCRVPGIPGGIDTENGNNWRYFPQAQLVSVTPGNPGKGSVVLTGNFYSACSPSVSFDGKSLLFAGQQKKDDPWNIWEMNLKNRKTRKVFSTSEDCIDPEYLPGNRLLFSRTVGGDTLKAGYSLFTCNADGTDVKRITFNPASYFASSVLADGRILTINKELHPEKKKEFYMVLRPDGTKAELFYKCTDGRKILSSPHETTGGKIYFVESGENGGLLMSVSYNRPLHSAAIMSNGITGDFRTVWPVNQGNLLVSLKKPGSERYGIYMLDPARGDISPVMETPDYDLIDVAKAEQHGVPRKLPSEVDMLVKTGLLLCTNVNMLGPSVQNKGKASRIEVLGLNESYGTVDIEPDGSFLIRAMADTPFRLQSLDEKGNIIQGPCAWISLRPNERRGCVGCHEDMETVPENRVPLAVTKAPVKLPVHIAKIQEKTVELE